ncbi:hypothetical protein [Streptomyces diastatochromogenes]|uniref:hypothetical protein n=1 Tax=Streptomyces diastatochromogenes TaxID=42236 RepID=UPI0036A39D00
MATARRCGRSGCTNRPETANSHAIAAPAAASAVWRSTSAHVSEALAATANENRSSTAPSPPSRVASQTYLATPATTAVAAATTAAPVVDSPGRAHAASADPQPTHAVMATATTASTRARRA